MGEFSRSNPLCYNSQVEISMILKDVKNSYNITDTGCIKISSNIKRQQVIVCWKPPGMDKWMEKYRSEVLPGKMQFFQFQAPLLLDLDDKDGALLPLRFEIHHQDSPRKTKGTFLQNSSKKLFATSKEEPEFTLWSVTYATVQKIVSAGPQGLDLFLPLDFGIEGTELISSKCKEIFPGLLHIRGEVLQMSPFGIEALIGLETENHFDYYIELHKLNQENDFEMLHPYTLVYRSSFSRTFEQFHPGSEGHVDGGPHYFEESRLSNGDPFRILKIDIFRKDNHDRKGFALFTLAMLATQRTVILDVEKIDSFSDTLKKCLKKDLMKVVIRLQRSIAAKPIDHYLSKGWHIVPIFAFDFSRSNWCKDLHTYQAKDKALGEGPIEEAIRMATEPLNAIALSYAMVFGFGSLTPFSEQFRTGPHFPENVLEKYNDAQLLCLMLRQAIRDNAILLSSKDKGAAAMRTLQSEEDAQNAIGLPQSLLTPFLSQELSSLLHRRKNAFEYFVAVIITDGQFSDEDQDLANILKELSVLPISLIFIGVGQENFQRLNDLPKLLGGSYRNFIHVINFRSLCHWECSLAKSHRTHSRDVFTKELITPVMEQAVQYLKMA